MNYSAKLHIRYDLVPHSPLIEQHGPESALEQYFVQNISPDGNAQLGS